MANKNLTALHLEEVFTCQKISVARSFRPLVASTGSTFCSPVATLWHPWVSHSISWVSYYLGMKEWGRTGCFEVDHELERIEDSLQTNRLERTWPTNGINLYKQVNLTILWITILLKKRTSFHWDQTLIRLNQHTWHMSSFSRRITSFHEPRRGFCRSTVVQLRRGFCDGRWKMWKI